MLPLKIEITQCERAPEITIIRFIGDLDTGSIADISGCFRMVRENNTHYVVADMSDVNAISSAALGELLGGRKSLIERGGELFLACLTMDIKTKLTLMGANRIFKFYNDIRSAINAYKWEFEGKPECMRLSFPPQLRFVPAVRQLASRIARQKGYNRRDSFRIETIVDEICNNAVEHGVAGSLTNVDLSLNIDRKKMEIEVINTGDPEKIETLKKFLAPTHQPNPDFSVDFRGRGLSLIKLLANELDIDFSDGGTSVRATKLREE